MAASANFGGTMCEIGFRIVLRKAFARRGDTYGAEQWYKDEIGNPLDGRNAHFKNGRARVETSVFSELIFGNGDTTKHFSVKQGDFQLKRGSQFSE